MLHNPSTKYRPFPPVPMQGRRWPGRTIERAPVWMSTDLRDGNQALIEPMTLEMKLEFFDMLVAIGFKEIEVGFPSASQTDFDFVRRLIDERRIPDDVTIEVLSHAREDLLRRTFDALDGAARAIVHQVNAISPTFRRVVFAQSREQVKALAVNGTRVIRQLAAERPATHWTFEYSPEMFSTTELAFSREVCDAVAEVWQPTPEHKMIINLPASVEAATPNIYADQIEWMDSHLSYRDSIVLSVHPHNDRGTAVAAAELALMAGADRVEGCLFGNGERTGNVDLVTLALNLYTQGIDPGLDFSNLDAVRRVVERCNQIPVHARHPYAGELVFTAFSGSHQDAIRKGFAQQQPDTVWEVPYLPIDPADLGRDYAALIRVNSQSGKGGTTYVIERALGFTPPRHLQIEFSRVVQAHAEASGAEVTSEALVALFEREYFEVGGPLARTAGTALRCRGRDIAVPLAPQDKVGFTDAESVAQQIEAASGLAVRVTACDQAKLADGRSACCVACRIDGGAPKYGVAVHAQPGVALIEAMAGAVNRALAAQQPDTQCAA